MESCYVTNVWEKRGIMGRLKDNIIYAWDWKNIPRGERSWWLRLWYVRLYIWLNHFNQDQNITKTEMEACWL